MKVILRFELLPYSSSTRHYELYAEYEPTPLANGKVVRYLKIYRLDTIVPYCVAEIVQTINGNTWLFEGHLVPEYSSERDALNTAMNWLKTKWDGKL